MRLIYEVETETGNLVRIQNSPATVTGTNPRKPLSVRRMGRCGIRRLFLNAVPEVRIPVLFELYEDEGTKICPPAGFPVAPV